MVSHYYYTQDIQISIMKFKQSPTIFKGNNKSFHEQNSLPH